MYRELLGPKIIMQDEINVLALSKICHNSNLHDSNPEIRQDKQICASESQL